MYTGQIAVISNRADWISPFFAQIVLDDGTIIDILNPDIGFDCSVTIRDEDSHCVRLEANIANGKVIVSQGDDGPGFEWSFLSSELRSLCPGTYGFGIKTTTNGEIKDLVDATLAVIEGN